MTKKGDFWVFLLLAIGTVISISGSRSVLNPNFADISLKLQSLADVYGSDQINRLTSVASALITVGITGDLLLICLSQILQETGLFDGLIANYRLMDNFNYAGLTDGNGHYNEYADYNEFATDYLNFLNHYPGALQAKNVTQFVNALVADPKHKYFTDSPATYIKRVQHFYNILRYL